MGSTVSNQGTLGSSSDGGMDSNYTEVVVSSDRGTRYLEITGTGEITQFFTQLVLETTCTLCFSFNLTSDGNLLYGFDGNKSISIDTNGVNLVQGYDTYNVTASNLCDNNWHYIAVVCTDQKVLFYIDGWLEYTGGFTFTSGHYFSCFTVRSGVMLLDDIRIYDCELTFTQISAFIDPTKYLQLYYSFDTWTSVLDSIVQNEGSLGLSNNGVMTNAAIISSDFAVGLQCFK